MYFLATDTDPENPNPHAWNLEGGPFSTEEEASQFAQREEDELRREYGDEYAGEAYRWLVVKTPYGPQTEAITNIQIAIGRIARVWEWTKNEELADAQAELEQAVRFLTGKEIPE